MKVIGIILIILCIAALGAIGYMYFHASVDFTYVACIATDPADVPDYFEQIRHQVEQDSFPGVRFSKEMLLNPQDYVFYTWIVRVDNDTYLQAKAVELQLTPITGDVLMIPDEDQKQVLVNPGDQYQDVLAYLDKAQKDIIKSGDHETRAVTFLTKKNTRSIREASVDWYLGGLHFPTVPQYKTIGD